MKNPTGRLVVQTKVSASPIGLDAVLPAIGAGHEASVWVTEDEGFIGAGVAASYEAVGPHRFSDAQAWWRELCHGAVVDDQVETRGTGLIALGTFTFSADHGSKLIVPRIIGGTTDGQEWLTTIRWDDEEPADDLFWPPWTGTPAEPETRLHDPADGRRDFVDIVARGVDHIRHGHVDKIVLSRTVEAQAASELALGPVLARLHETYRSCWTFAVDGFFGATPEMLVRRQDGIVSSRVLAGTAQATGDGPSDEAAGRALMNSAKNRQEHRYAVESVAAAFAHRCSRIDVPAEPFVLTLPNVLHLATDVRATQNDAADTVLSLVADLHPSAAVGGTPRAQAMSLIEELESADRGRYAGPVGWVDAHGDGEWGIGLRSAQVSGTAVRLYAGCGIMADSDPEAELAETDAKLLPVKQALAGVRSDQHSRDTSG